MPEILTKRWLIAEPVPPDVRQELDAFSDVLAQLMYNRGVRTRAEADTYLNAEPPTGADPANMLGIDAAADRILHAVGAGEKIVVYGDYDVDGVTATALLSLALSALGADVMGYIPNRFDEGYGLNVEALAGLHAAGTGLVITVDCGIRSIKEAEFARELGMDLVISDHHHPGAALPPAHAIINPKQAGDGYPEKDLAGVGLAYKLVQALYAHPLADGLGTPARPSAEEFLDLVALGTVADIAPLTGENRSLVRAGLERLRLPRRQGLVSLLGVAGLLDTDNRGKTIASARRLNAGHIGYVLGPRLNAAGRLDSALAALDLLTKEDLNETGALAQLLNAQNRERQDLTRSIQEAAEQMALERAPEAPLLFAVHEDFNEGVVGLAASRLTETHYRPAVVGRMDAETTRASCRSIPEFHITAALDQCADLLERHGGHAAAAGFTVRNENLTELIERLMEIAQDQLAGLDLRPTLQADMELPLRELKPGLLPELDRLEPTGHKNPQARFVSRNLRVRYPKVVGQDGSHLKMAVTDGAITYDAIAFRQGHRIKELAAPIDILYAYEINEYNGRKSLQLNVKDFKQTSIPE